MKKCKISKCNNFRSARNLCQKHYHKHYRKTKKYKTWLTKNTEKHRARKKNWANKNRNKRRGYMFKFRYGISYEDYLKMSEKQNHLCYLCNKDSSDLGRPLYVDHCHKTAKIRGLLCFHCNMALGHLKDDINLLKKALKYLIKFS